MNYVQLTKPMKIWLLVDHRTRNASSEDCVYLYKFDDRLIINQAYFH